MLGRATTYSDDNKISQALQAEGAFDGTAYTVHTVRYVAEEVVGAGAGYLDMLLYGNISN